MEEEPLVFEYGRVRFEVHRSNIQDDCEPPLSATKDVIGLHTAAHATHFPVNTNSDLSIIFGEQTGTVLPPVITPDTFRSLMTSMLVADYLAPWVDEKRTSDIFRTACDLTINLIYETGLLKEEVVGGNPRDEIIRGKRQKRQVNYAESDSDESTSPSSDDEDSLFEMDQESPKKKNRKSSNGSDNNSCDEESESSESSESSDISDDDDDSGSIQSEESLAEEKDLYVFTHERVRGYVMKGLGTAQDRAEWKLVFDEWWDKCFESRFMENPDLYDIIWPRIERINYEINPHRKRKKNDLDIYIAEAMASTIKTVKNQTVDKFPLKATRTSSVVGFEMGDITFTFCFKAGFTQPQPLQKRGKVAGDKSNKNHKVVVVHKKKANPILLKVTGGGIFYALKKVLKQESNIDIDKEKIQFMAGFGGGKGWIEDVFDMEVMARNVELKYVHNENRSEYTTLLLSLHSRVMGSMTQWGLQRPPQDTQTKIDITEYAVASSRFHKATLGVHDLYHKNLFKDQRGKFSAVYFSEEVKVYSLIYLYSSASSLVEELEEHVGYDSLDHSKPDWEQLAYTPHGVQSTVRSIAQVLEILKLSRLDDQSVYYCSKGIIDMDMERVRKLQACDDAITLISNSLKHKISWCGFSRCWERLKDGSSCYPRRSKKLNTNVIKTIKDMREFNKKINEMLENK